MCVLLGHIPSGESSSYLVAGLGNIGDEYAGTRHNMGFMMLDSWTQDSNIIFSSERYGSIAEMSYKGRKLYLLKPSTYMNLSGNAIRYWLIKKKIPISNLVVICDDLNLPFGTVRMRKSGSDGGHNGLKNIQDVLQTRDFTRIRLGIGHDFEAGEQVDFVLGGLSAEEKSRIPQIASKVLQGVRDYCTVGADRAMNSLNIKDSSAK